jgi:hypothetical protein
MRTPSRTRYTAPTSFTIMNAVTDSWRIEPTPAATSSACRAGPPVLPTTVASAARRPSATPRLTTNSTLGPGIEDRQREPGEVARRHPGESSPERTHGFRRGGDLQGMSVPHSESSLRRSPRANWRCGPHLERALGVARETGGATLDVDLG